MEFKNRFFKESKESYFLFGPRGVGKSLWLNKNYKNALFIDLLLPGHFFRYQAKPETLIEIIDGNPEKKIIIIDEVQKVPEILNVVHKLIEDKRDIRFILTGSSTRKLKRTGVDLLAGRAVLKHLHPFMAKEIKKSFNLKDALNYGLIPLVINSTDPDETLNAYIALYIKEEVQMEGFTRNISNFARFLESISFSHASVINISEVSRECMIKRKTVESYIAILEDILLAFRVPIFTKRAKRLLTVHPKFYFFDAGVFSKLRPKGVLDKNSEIEGAALEGLVAQHLMAWNSYNGEKHSISYWRTKSGNEVDFIIYGENDFLAIEVKNTIKIRNNDLRGLKAFRKDYPDCSALFLYRGKEKLKINDTLCLPVDYFLKNISPEKKLTGIF